VDASHALVLQGDDANRLADVRIVSIAGCATVAGPAATPAGNTGYPAMPLRLASHQLVASSAAQQAGNAAYGQCQCQHQQVKGAGHEFSHQRQQCSNQPHGMSQG
jgi:hypothetical protein